MNPPNTRRNDAVLRALLRGEAVSKIDARFKLHRSRIYAIRARFALDVEPSTSYCVVSCNDVSNVAGPSSPGGASGLPNEASPAPNLPNEPATA
jgi:hypothetical protein